ncbi:hypothetical protein [Streptomyces sp. CRN 30]|uniref:hypothetical protein n=1 Tax=Streptomyces sp. CRN 30 TaxID=3075613 RepID=UPI002A7FB169|nr:hypothetical protein [Streptomyces sp. CRN 30]
MFRDTPIPVLSVTTSPLTGDGMPTELTDQWRQVLDQGLGGGAATSSYLAHIARAADFIGYLGQQGEDAFTVTPGPSGGWQAVATDGCAILQVGATLAPFPPDGDPPVSGTAVVRLSLPNPYQVVQYTEFGVQLAELPAGFVLTRQVWQALAQPLLSRVVAFVRQSVRAWLDLAPDEDVSGLGDALAQATQEAGEAAAEETAEITVGGEAVAEVAVVDFSAAFPPLAGLAVLAAVPLILAALAKNFVLRLQVVNMTDLDIEVTVPYQADGAMTVEPADPVLPAMGQVTDAWGDRSTVDVAYLATFSATNRSGYSGLGFLLNLSPAGSDGADVCAVVSVPWGSDNTIWLGDTGSDPDWGGIYDANSDADGLLRVDHGNRVLAVSLAIDALSGNADTYDCVLRVQPL